MSNTIKTIGARIRKHRNDMHLSQEELAERADMHFTYIGQVERGEKNITVGSLEKICLALGITFEELFIGLGPDNDNNSIAQEITNLVCEKSPKIQNVCLNVIKEISKL